MHALKSATRNTPIRTGLLEIVAKHREPLTAQELLQLLKTKGLVANKTTVYRQLEALVRFGILKEVHFADRTTRYESAVTDEHHHHLVCVHCQRIEDISLSTDLEREEKTIWKNKKFKVLQHSLEFFGICHNCNLKPKNL